MVLNEKFKMSQSIGDQGGHFLLQNTIFVEDVEHLLPVSLRQIPFCSCKGEVENVSTNQIETKIAIFIDGSALNTNMVEDRE